MTAHCSCKALLMSTFGPTTLRGTRPPSFLLPAFSNATQRVAFSVSSHPQARKDGNPWRGVSALRRTGLNSRIKLSVNPANLPKPVLDPAKRTIIKIDPDHGLWEFLGDQEKPMLHAGELAAHGRAWAVSELRNKDWDDLYRLWWRCIKERNRIETSERERKRVMSKGYGQHEYEERLKEIRGTMKAIRATLLERWYSWENARVAAMEDDEVNLYADPALGQPVYNPRSYDDDALNSGSRSATTNGAPADPAFDRSPQQTTVNV